MPVFFLTTRPLFPLRYRFTHNSTIRMALDSNSALVSPQWIASRQPRLLVLDASWHLPSAKRDAHEEYLAEHIPGARRFDIDGPGLCDATSELAHMLPDADSFRSAARKLGLRKDVPAVVYATNGFVGAARAWWMLRYFGKDDVYVLDGGLGQWKKEGMAMESGQESKGEEGDWEPAVRKDLVRDMEQMLRQVDSGEGVILDARSKGRFDGTEKESRAGLRGGHMPGSFSVPCGMVLTEDGKMKGKEELKSVFEEVGVDKLRQGPVSISCGSGVTAAIDALALFELGIDAAVYDGSWSEWGRYESNPIVKS